MALEMNTDTMRERSSQISDYLQQNFGDRVGHLLVLFNMEGISVASTGSDKDVMRATLTLLFELISRLQHEYGPTVANQFLVEGMNTLAKDKDIPDADFDSYMKNFLGA